MAGINQAIQSDPYENYDFSIVRCGVCQTESPVFIYKDNLTADEQIEYIKDITGYIINTNDGGLLCQKCRIREI